MSEKLLNICYNPINIKNITGFTKAQGCIVGNSVDVYFVRLIGANTSLSRDVINMDSVMSQKSDLYIRISGLSNIPIEDIAYYTDCCKKWYDSNQKSVPLNRFKNNEYMQGIFSEACKMTISVFKQLSHTSISIERNFVTKLLYWFDKLFEGKNFNCKQVKIVSENITKKQEYLFFYMLTQMGYSVLLLQTMADIPKNLEQLGFSTKNVIGNFVNEPLPNYNYANKNVNNNVQDVTPNNVRVTLPQRNRPTKNQPQNIQNEVRISQPIPPKRPLQQQSRSVGFIGGSDNVPVNREKTFEELAQLAESVVMIIVSDRNGKPFASGSGIMIGNNGYILTNFHVVKGGVIYSVRIENDNNIYNTDELIKYNTVSDLAIIRINRRLKSIPLYNGRKPLVRGQKVVAIGSPLGLFNSVSDGIISGFRNIKDDVKMIQFTAPISNGNSGGALLNMYGEVIGIVTAGIDEGQNLNLAVHCEEIYNFVRGFV